MARVTAWVAQLTRQQHVPVPWARMIRMGVAVGVPVTVGVLVGQLGIGLLCSIGALGASLADAEGPYRSRVVRVGWATVGGLAGFAIGGAVFTAPVVAAVVIVLGGLVAGIVSVLGAVASLASLQFLIYLIVAAGADFGPVPRWVLPTCYVIGSAWALGLSLTGGIGRASVPGRVLVATVYMHLSEYTEAAGAPGAVEARRRLTDAMNAAYDAVMVSRATVGGSDRRIRRQAALLNAATPVIEATTARSAAGIRVPGEISAWVRAAAVYIRRPGDGAPGPLLDVLVLDDPAWRDVADGLGAVADILGMGRGTGAWPGGGSAAGGSGSGGGAGAEAAPSAGPSPVTRALRLPGALPAPVTVADRLRTLGDALTAGPETWLPTIRLVLCLAVAEIAAAADPVERPYWIVMTVAIVLKPDFGSVFARALQRGVGTIVGVVLGSAILAIAPGHVLPLVAIAVFAALMPFAQKRNYGMFATVVTPVIVLLLDLGAGGGFDLVIGRATDTAIGCVIVLAVGYLPWPDTWRSHSRFGPRIARAAEASAAYLYIALGAASGTRQAARRRAYRQLSDLRTGLQQAFSEPPPVSRAAAAWWPVVVTLERLVDATTAVAVRPAPTGWAAADVDRLAQATAAVGDVACGGPARPVALPEDPDLEPVTAEIRAAHALLRRMARNA